MTVENRRRRQSDEHKPLPFETEAQKEKRLLATPIAAMGLSMRSVNTLEDNDIILCQDLMRHTWESLTAMKNFGAKTLVEVRAAILALGLTPPDWTPPPPAPRAARPRRKTHFSVKLR